MPVLKDVRKTIKIDLPSFEDGWVELYEGLLYGDLKELEKETSEFKRGVKALELMIKDWNLTDEKGEKLPITEENLNLIPTKDLLVLLGKVAEFMGESEKKRPKVSKKSS